MNKLLVFISSLILIELLGSCTIISPSTPTSTPILESTATPIPIATNTNLPSMAATQAIIVTYQIDTNQTGFRSIYYPVADSEENWDPFIDGMTKIYIPPGEFLMGSPKNKIEANYNPEANYDEKPVHKVFVDGFWIDRTEVTNEMFAVFLNVMGNQKQGRSTWLNADSKYVNIHLQDGKWEADTGYEQYPVVGVSWFGANSYCGWAGKRLPTEAEWEKAARGVDGRTYPWGEIINCNMANYKGCIESLARVGSFPMSASPYGVLDMAGNAVEWVKDWYAEDTYKFTLEQNPTGPLEGYMRVIRGGSWLSVGNYLRAAYRDKIRPDDSGYATGFRCALTNTEP